MSNAHGRFTRCGMSDWTLDQWRKTSNGWIRAQRSTTTVRPSVCPSLYLRAEPLGNLPQSKYLTDAPFAMQSSTLQGARPMLPARPHQKTFFCPGALAEREPWFSIPGSEGESQASLSIAGLPAEFKMTAIADDRVDRAICRILSQGSAFR